MKRKVVIDGKVHTVQGGTEERLMPRLIAKFGNERDVVTQFNTKLYPKELANTVCGYRPDFYVFSKDLFIEAKSTWTLYGLPGELRRNRRKAKQAGSRLLWVIESHVKGVFITLPTKWYTWNKDKLVDYIDTQVERKLEA